jgi:hypothetical protein
LFLGARLFNQAQALLLNFHFVPVAQEDVLKILEDKLIPFLGLYDA